MANRSSKIPTSVLVAGGLVVAACSSNVTDAPPRVSSIPLQVTPGGTAVTLDLSTYVRDREGGAMTFAVVSGGGSFAGSTYTNTFATLGEWTVEFDVSDDTGHTTRASFDVRVTSAHLAAVQESATGLLLLDTMTNEFVRIASSSPAPTFKAGLGDGRVLFERSGGSTQQLWVFDTFSRTSRQVGSPSADFVTYRAKTSDGRIVFTTGPGSDTNLFIYNPVTNLVREISAVVGELDGDARVNSQDLVFYERGNGGQADIYYFDPAADTSTAVATGATDEQLLAVLADGGIVFSRVGAGGESDLFYFRRNFGVVEIGLDITGLDLLDKTFGGGGTGGEVVFTAQNGSDTDIYAWSPSTGVTTSIASGAVYGFDAIGPGNELVYHRQVSGGERDLFFYDLDDGTAATVRDSTDVSTLLAIADGAVAWAIVRGSATSGIMRAVQLVATPPAAQTVDLSGAGGLGGTLSNGDVVCQRDDGGALAHFDATAGTWDAAITGTGLAFGGDGVASGDFVYAVTVAAQQDLSMWDESLGGSVVVSNATGDDVFQSRSLDATVLFSRGTSGSPYTQLCVWEPVGGDEVLLETDDVGISHTYTISGTFSCSR